MRLWALLVLVLFCAILGALLLPQKPQKISCSAPFLCRGKHGPAIYYALRDLMGLVQTYARVNRTLPDPPTWWSQACTTPLAQETFGRYPAKCLTQRDGRVYDQFGNEVVLLVSPDDPGGAAQPMAVLVSPGANRRLEYQMGVQEHEAGDDVFYAITLEHLR